ncbi:hypothetical protein TNCV_3121201 [Trichonephila clavipes]|nr:hypothetical protein TNCV_3121201 [Trichonephila clavipes]
MLVRVLTKTLRPLDCKWVYFKMVLFARCSKMEATTTTEAEGYIRTLVEVLSRQMAFATKNRYNYGLNTDHLGSIGSRGAGWVLWREIARYRFSSARLVYHLPESDALARKDTLWPCASLALTFTTLGRH